MKLRLTKTAARQLDEILTYIAKTHPPGALVVLGRIQTVMHMLLQHPHTGQATGRHGIRRMVVSPHPDLLTYRVGHDEIVIRTVRHTSRRPLA